MAGFHQSNSPRHPAARTWHVKQGRDGAALPSHCNGQSCGRPHSGDDESACAAPPPAYRCSFEPRSRRRPSIFHPICRADFRRHRDVHPIIGGGPVRASRSFWVLRRAGRQRLVLLELGSTRGRRRSRMMNRGMETDLAQAGGYGPPGGGGYGPPGGGGYGSARWRRGPPM